MKCFSIHVVDFDCCDHGLSPGLAPHCHGPALSCNKVSPCYGPTACKRFRPGPLARRTRTDKQPASKDAEQLCLWMPPSVFDFVAFWSVLHTIKSLTWHELLSQVSDYLLLEICVSFLSVGLLLLLYSIQFALRSMIVSWLACATTQ